MNALSAAKGRIGSIIATVLLCACAATPPQGSGGGNIEVANALAQGRLETLYYEELPPNLMQLVNQPGMVPQLGEGYALEADPINRFNIIVILNRRAKVFEAERSVIADVLRRALADRSSWVRTEAVWGYGFLGTSDDVRDVAPLLDDAEPGVVNEAILALARMTGAETLPNSNERMSNEARASAVRFWKDRLARTKAGKSPAYAPGWTPENLQMMVAGCRAAIVAKNLQEMQQHAGAPDALPSSVKDELVKAMEPFIAAICDCAIPEMAKDVPMADFSPNSPNLPKVQERMKALVEMGVCAPKGAPGR